jgi:hypothetical protein
VNPTRLWFPLKTVAQLVVKAAITTRATSFVDIFIEQPPKKFSAVSTLLYAFRAGRVYLLAAQYIW